MRKKHPYYDSDRKKRTEDFATKAIAWSLLGIIFLFIIASITGGCGNTIKKEECSDDLFVPTQDDIMVLDTLYDMVKETEQDIDSIFIDIDKINKKLDDLIEQRSKEAHSMSIQEMLENKDPDYMYMDTTMCLDLADELADVLFVLICLANQTGVNLEEAFLKNLMKKTSRDADRHINNKKL